MRIKLIEKNVESYLSSLETKFSGVLLLTVGNQKVISKGYGQANYELDVANTTTTKCRIGSVTKQFTAVAILQLCEKGLITLNDTVNQYLPNYPNGSEITIHHLLTHTSGIFNYTNMEDFMTKTMRTAFTTTDLIDLFKNLPTEFEPGSQYAYSNSGYHILGYIIEKISGQHYGDYVQENIFDILSMKNTGYDRQDKVIKNRASGYRYNEKQVLENCPFIDMNTPHAAGGIYSTVEDLHLWNTALFDHTILNELSLKKLLTPYIDDGKGGHYCYGIRLYNDLHHGKTRKEFSHGGGIPGFFTANRCYVNDDVQLIMITNINDEKFTTHVNAIAEIIFKNLG